MKKRSAQSLARVSAADYKTMEKRPLYVVLDNIRSLNNVGSVFRTCDAFAVKRLYLCGITARPPHRDIHRTALGATESVEWKYCGNTLEAVKELQAQGVEVWAVEQVEGSTMLDSFHPEPGRQYALVFGNEVFGVDQAVVDACSGAVEIPQEGTKHSLNIAVCVGAVLWDVFSKMRRGPQQAAEGV